MVDDGCGMAGYGYHWTAADVMCPLYFTAHPASLDNCDTINTLSRLVVASFSDLTLY